MLHRAGQEMNKIIKVCDRLFTKLEMNNTGGSHKYRAACLIIEDALNKGNIVPGVTTVIEKTGGNFGFGLIAACYRHGIPVELVVGLGFSPAKRDLLESVGAQLVGKDLLLFGASPKDVVNSYLENQDQLGKSYYYTDQFSNRIAIDAYRYHTAPELASQLIEEGVGHKLLFVGCAGTGASFTGVTSGLKDHGFDVSTVLVDPFGCDSKKGIFSDHRLEGMAVGVSPPFLDGSLVDRQSQVEHTEMLAAQAWFYRLTGLDIGYTSAACISVAQRLVRLPEYADTTCITIAYDAGVWYQN